MNKENILESSRRENKNRDLAEMEVTQCGQEVTATVAENMGRGESTVCLMAKQLGMDVFPVDIGVVRPIKSEKVLQFSVRRGTANFAHEPAMTRKEALEAVEIGIKMAEMCAEKGYSLLIGGEMGIGNTTTSAAVTAALTGVEAAAVTGRGAGLSTVGLERKIAVIEAALALHKLCGPPEGRGTVSGHESGLPT